MKKLGVYKCLYIISAAFFVAFIVFFTVDAFKYDTYKGSAPLYAYALIRAVEFILPSVILFIIATLVKRKSSGAK